MNKKNPRKNGTRRPGDFTPGKMVVVVALAIILVVVVVVQLPTQPATPVGAQRDRVDDTTAARRTPPARVVRRRPPRQPTQDSRQMASQQGTAGNRQVGMRPPIVHVANWPVRTLDDTDGTNPFELPVPLRNHVQERLGAETEQQRIDRLAEQQAESQRREQARLAELRQQRQAEKERLAERQRIEQERKRIQKVIDELRKKGVAIVLSDRNGRVAKIGERTIRVGDQFDGIEVTEIKENGSVLVRPIDPAIATETKW